MFDKTLSRTIEAITRASGCRAEHDEQLLLSLIRELIRRTVSEVGPFYDGNACPVCRMEVFLLRLARDPVRPALPLLEAAVNERRREDGDADRISD